MNNKQKIESEKDFYNVKKAGEKLIWRFSPNEKGEFKAFKPNDNDFKALKSILGMINRVEKNNVSNNQLFAKLFIYHLTMNIRYFETTVLDDYPQRDLASLLEKPLSLFYKSFHSDLQDNQLNKLVKYNDTNALIDQRIKDLRSGEVGVEASLLNSCGGLENYIKNKEKEKITDKQQMAVIDDYNHYKKTFTLEMVEGKLDEMINNALLNLN